MKFTKSLASVVVLVIGSSAFAGGGLEFEFTAPGGPISELNGGVNAYPLFMNDGYGFPSSVENITSLELQIDGLTHSTPWDLDIYLVNPFGTLIRVLADHGDQNAVEGVSLLFNDGGAALPVNPDDPLYGLPYNDDGLLPVMPEGPVMLNGSVVGTTFADAFAGTSGGTDAWLLWIIDDTLNKKGGSVESYTLRGTYVPEPMSLSLLALGGLVALRRRR